MDATSTMQGNGNGRQLLREIEVLWITVGLSCDGDTIAMTSATQPSIEDVVLGAKPGILYNPFLTYENGEEFIDFFYRAAAGEIDAQVIAGEDILPANGEFLLRQTDFQIKPVSAAGGAIKLKDELKFSFDIVAYKQ